MINPLGLDTASPQERTKRFSTAVFYGVILILTAMLSLISFWGLPELGIDTVANILNPFNLIKLLLMGSMAYFYLEFLLLAKRKQTIFLLFAAIGAPLLMFTGIFARQFGLNVHATLLVTGLVFIPMGFIAIPAIPEMLRKYPFIRFLGIFTLVVIYCYFFHKINYAPPQSIMASAQGLDENKNLSDLLFYDTIFQFLICALVIYVIGRARNYTQLFYRFNTCISVFSIVISIIPLYFFLTTKQFGVTLEGIFRFSGIFPHPNYNAVFLGLLSLYLLGIYLAQKSWSPQTSLLPISAGLITLLASLFSLAKTSISSYIALLSILVFVYLILNKVKLRHIVGMVVKTLVVSILLFFVINILSGNVWTDLLLARYQSVDSMDWRLKLWQQVIYGLDIQTLLFGNGLASSTQKVNELLYHAKGSTESASLVIHNIFLQNLFEFGFIGLTQILAMFSFFLDPFTSVRHFQPEKKSELLFLIALQFVLTAFYLIYLCFNINSYIYSSIYWVISSALYIYIIKRNAHDHEI
jgi:O-antigen ligase